MSYSTIDNDSPIANITRAFRDVRADEAVFIETNDFAAFQAACIDSWRDAPLGDDTAPESHPTVVAKIAA